MYRYVCYGKRDCGLCASAQGNHTFHSFMEVASYEMAPGCDFRDDCRRTLHDSEPAVVLLVLRWIVGAFR